MWTRWCSRDESGSTRSSCEAPLNSLSLSFPHTLTRPTCRAPISFIVFLVAMGLMEFKSPSQIWLKIQRAFFAILWTNYKVWPFIQVVMFLYVPLKYRVPLSGCINVLWTVYLSWETAVKTK